MRRRLLALHLALAAFAVGAVTLALRLLPVSNHTTVALLYLLVVLFVASSSHVAVAVASSVMAMLALNYFFMPPVGTFTIEDPHNWVALFAFLVVAVVASQLSAAARTRALEAVERAHFLEERQAAERARERAEFTSALLASFSHDLRTPLTAIDVAAANLAITNLAPELRAEQLAIVRSEVERLKRLFENILDMTRIDSETLRPEREWVRLADVVDASAARASPALADHALRIEADDAWEAQMDLRLTASAVSQLLENAARYSPAGTAIAVRAWLEGAMVRIDVLDEGPGIAPGDLPHVFDRFYRGTNARAGGAAGSGMGLAIARGLLAAEGAAVWAGNRPEGGAVFSVSLEAPVRRARSDAEEVQK